MDDIRALHTLADYEWALKEIEPYFKDVPVPGTEAAKSFRCPLGTYREI
jgi:hypothetical protein